TGSGLASCFFQAEAGIRDGHVTGVQTCALPISPPPTMATVSGVLRDGAGAPLGGWEVVVSNATAHEFVTTTTASDGSYSLSAPKIGRASCRERVEMAVVAVTWENRDT